MPSHLPWFSSRTPVTLSVRLPRRPRAGPEHGPPRSPDPPSGKGHGPAHPDRMAPPAPSLRLRREPPHLRQALRLPAAADQPPQHRERAGTASGPPLRHRRGGSAEGQAAQSSSAGHAPAGGRGRARPEQSIAERVCREGPRVVWASRMFLHGFVSLASEIFTGVLPRCLPTSGKIYAITRLMLLFYHITTLHITTSQLCYCRFIVMVFNCFVKWNERQNVFSVTDFPWLWLFPSSLAEIPEVFGGPVSMEQHMRVNSPDPLSCFSAALHGITEPRDGSG